MVAQEAATRARAALLRRRPDLAARGGKRPATPGDEEAQVTLDTLAFLSEVTARLNSELTSLVFEARRHGASWARVGVALGESPQTAFNRYRHLEQPAAKQRPKVGTGRTAAAR